MEIIMQGNTRKANRTIRFTCDNCNCVFEADSGEYRYILTDWGEESSITCLCCGNTVYGSYKKD